MNIINESNLTNKKYIISLYSSTSVYSKMNY